jgi:cell division protein FtsB
MTSPGTEPARAVLRGRQADSARRRARVTQSISAATAAGHEISPSSIARAAGVDRTFLYRHRDLLEQVHLAQANTTTLAGTRPTASSASLQADLLNAQQRAARLSARVHQLEDRLSSLLGEQAWRESGLGAPASIDTLKQHNHALEQQIIDLRLQLGERDQDLAAARAANRELMTQINATACRR